MGMYYQLTIVLNAGSRSVVSTGIYVGGVRYEVLGV